LKTFETLQQFVNLFLVSRRFDDDAAPVDLYACLPEGVIDLSQDCIKRFDGVFDIELSRLCGHRR
jgi:hypothetical protein